MAGVRFLLEKLNTQLAGAERERSLWASCDELLDSLSLYSRALKAFNGCEKREVIFTSSRLLTVGRALAEKEQPPNPLDDGTTRQREDYAGTTMS